jgi:Tfp pilus assembly protein PilN
VGLVLGMALFLADRYRTLNDSYVACQAHNTHHAWMESLTEQQIEQERQDLKQKVAALRKFLGSRVTWTSHQRALAACIPDNVALTSFQGASELESGQKTGGQGKPAKSLVLRGAAVIPENGLVPHEIDRFLDTLRAHPSLTRDFPVVELGDLKQLAGTHGEAPLASFTVVCLPKAQQGAAE